MLGHRSDKSQSGRVRGVRISLKWNTEYRPLRLESLRTLAEQLLTGRVPDGETTADRIRSARAAESRTVQHGQA